jgi:hypothetical protein
VRCFDWQVSEQVVEAIGHGEVISEAHNDNSDVDMPVTVDAADIGCVVVPSDETCAADVLEHALQEVRVEQQWFCVTFDVVAHVCMEVVEL